MGFAVLVLVLCNVFDLLSDSSIIAGVVFFYCLSGIWCYSIGLELPVKLILIILIYFIVSKRTILILLSESYLINWVLSLYCRPLIG